MLFNVKQQFYYIKIVLNITDRKRHAAFPHGRDIVMYRPGDNVYMAVFGSVLQGN